MILNYFKLAIRLLLRNPFFTFINVLGLSVGFAVFFVLYPFASAELKSDQFLKDFEDITRVVVDWKWTDNGGESWGQVMIATAPGYVSSELVSKNPSVQTTRITHRLNFDELMTGLRPDVIVAVGREGERESLYKNENIICADANIFDFFGLAFTHGNPAKALQTAHSVVLSESTAAKYFGHDSPLKHLIRINGNPYSVTGVYKDLPNNSHLKFDIVISNVDKLPVWDAASFHNGWLLTYFKTKNPASLQRSLSQENESFRAEIRSDVPHVNANLMLQPLKSVVFSKNFSQDTFVPKSRFMLGLLKIVSVLVFGMAWMNYINLAVSKTNSRFKELAARRVSGAIAKDIFFQFLCQSVLINLIGVLFGLTFIQLIRQPFSGFFGIHAMELRQIDASDLVVVGLVLLTGIFGMALYPARIAVRHSARQLIIKKKSSPTTFVSQLLTVFQYVCSLTLVTWILSMYLQLDFILKKDLGLKKDGIIVIDVPIIGVDGNNSLTTFVDRLKNLSSVENASLSHSVAGDYGPINTHVRRVGSDLHYGMDSHGGVDENFISLYSIEMLAGRNFLKDEKSGGVILSKHGSDRLGFLSPPDAIGKAVEIWQPDGSWTRAEVIGVFSDFRVSSFLVSDNATQSVTGRGICLTYLDEIWKEIPPQRISVRFSSTDLSAMVDDIGKVYEQNFPGNPFNWRFIEDNINSSYAHQRTYNNQILFFTLLAISVSCLGLLGVFSNMLVERTKEIGIRKVLGAGMSQIAGLLLSSTFKQILVSVVISTPVAFLLIQQYLQRFSERIPLQWWQFVLPVTLLIAIVLATVSAALGKAARANPIESLRYE